MPVLLAPLMAIVATVLPGVPGGAMPLREPRVTGADDSVPGDNVQVADVLAEDTWAQVRIEQRLIVRVAPGSPGDAARLPPMQMPMLRFQGKRQMSCVPVASIGGVRVSTESRLVLFLRDRRFVGATLAKGCNAQDYYQGFYVEPHGDAQLCVGRDTIHSRSGASCTFSGLKELVPSP